jgi:hypothetical protein
VAYFRLGDPAGSTVACQSAGPSSGSYLGGASPGQAGALAGDPDTAAAFDGSSGYVSVPANTSLNVGDHFTIEAWVKRASFGGFPVIASKQNGAWVLEFNPSNQLVLRRSTVADVATSSTSVTDTAWHYVVATKDGATSRLYIDGVDVTGTVSNQTMVDNTQPLVIGQSTGSSFFSGTIDEIALYNTALSASQVSAHYQAGASPPPPPPPGCSPRSSTYSAAITGTAGLLSYFRLGDAAGSTVACPSLGSQTGTYVGGASPGQPGALAGDADTAAAFNGSSAYVSVPASASLNVGDHFTIEAWVKRASFGGVPVIASKQSGAWVLEFNSSNQLVLRRSTIADVATSTRTVNDAGWHYVAATKDGATSRLYIDGVDVTGTVNDQTMVDNTQPLVIGQSTGSSFFAGTIDEVALYNTALTTSQIQSHYTAGTGQTSDPVIAAAGDIACGTAEHTVQPGVACDQLSTSNLLADSRLMSVLALGDDQYEEGQLSDFMTYFDPSWGRFKTIMRSVPGNHEYNDPAGGAQGYFDYFDGVGNSDGPGGPRTLGYYSYDIGSWHLIAINSNCNPSGGGWRPGGCAAGSAQEQWLKSDLAAHPSSCTLAFWHHPLYSSSSQPDGASPFMSAIWADLANAHADVVLNGHAHNYERFALQNASGAVDTQAGMREFIVGTGGRNLYPFATIKPNSEVRNASTFGVLRLTLHPSSYDWQFQPETGGTFTDAGSQACHGSTLVDTSPPSSSASSPGVSATSTFSVGYTAADAAGGSGLAEVDLYAKGPGQSVYSKVASDTSGAASGSFSYQSGAGDGAYSFYTVATDNAGNVEVAPASADATTLVDTSAPSSSASSPAVSATSTFTVGYTAADTAGGSGVAKVDLFAEGPGQVSYSKVATDTSGAASGSFSFTASAGDGSYSFYTVATDKAGNSEAAPSGADASTLVATAAPSSSASSPAISATNSFAVSYNASDSPGVGLASVDLYAKAPGQSSYSKVASDTSGAHSGSFSYTAAAGDGTYSFYTIATDGVGNTESAPASADTTTNVDTTAPSSSASAPALSGAGAVTVGYTVSDGAAGSGIAQVDLYAKAPGDSSYSRVASDTSGAGSGSFSYAPAAGDGTYSFYTVATDKAGNAESAPASADASTLVDATAPSSSATAPAQSATAAVSVAYTAADEGGSALSRVDLYAKGPGQSSYSKVASDTSGAGSGSFSFTAESGDGTYSFYTVATDKAGNAESAPASADATTLVDTTAPTSSASSPATSATGSWSVTYTASDGAAGTGVTQVDLYAKAPGEASYSKIASDTSGASSGSFPYAAAAGDGTYSFYTVATDKLGHVEMAPATPDAGTALTRDVTAPTSQASAAAYSTASSWPVSYTAADNAGGSGLAAVELWVRRPGAKAFVKTATNTDAAQSGTFTYTASAGEGIYGFYTVAVDGQGNREAAPSAPDVSTRLDGVAPSAFAITSPAQYVRATVKLTLASAPTDAGSGMANVAYQYRPAGSLGAWAAACTATASPWSCSLNTATAATPDGAYELRAIASDKAGNTTLAANAPVGPITIDNSAPTAKTVATTNVGGGTAGRPEAGDSVTFGYSETMRPTSLLEGWNGAASPVAVKFTAKSAKDTTLAVFNAAGTAQLAIANPLDLGAAYVPSGGATFAGTMSETGPSVTVVLESLSSGGVLATPGMGGKLTWTPNSKATDLAGNKVSTAKVTAAGPAF